MCAKQFFSFKLFINSVINFKYEIYLSGESAFGSQSLTFQDKNIVYLISFSNLMVQT